MLFKVLVLTYTFLNGIRLPFENGNSHNTTLIILLQRKSAGVPKITGPRQFARLFSSRPFNSGGRFHPWLGRLSTLTFRMCRKGYLYSEASEKEMDENLVFME